MAKQHKKSVPQAGLSAEQKKETVNEVVLPHVQDFFEKAGAKTWWILAAILTVVLVILFRDYLFYSKVYMFKDIACDSYNLSYPNIHNTAEYFAKYGIPKWSFRSGMGQSVFPFMLRDPFNLFLYLGGPSNIGYGLGFFEVVKILMSGIFFYFFLKQLKVLSFTAITGAMFFALCGFMVEGSAWYGFTYEGMNLALMLLGFELLYNEGKWFVFMLAVFGIAISMPFNLYVYGLFVALYAILRSLQSDEADMKKMGLLFAKMIGIGVVGILLAGPFLLENIVQLLESPRGSGATSLATSLSAGPMFDTPEKFEFGTGIMRLFSTDLMHSGDNFKGWQNILEAPLYYCGLPCLLLMPQVFGSLGRKAKILFGVFLLVWLLPMFFPYFRHAFWLFTGDYYRAYSFFVGIVFIIYSVYALDHILKTGKVNLIVLVVTLVALFALLNYPYFEDPEFVSSSLKAYIILMLLVYAGIIYAIGKYPQNVNLRYVFLFLVLTELCYLPGITISERNSVEVAELHEKKGYNDYTVDAMKFISQSDRSFFRVDKSYSSGVSRFATINDGLAQDFNGTSSYNPFNQLNYVKFLQSFDVAQKGNELDARWARGLMTKPILEIENRVKYMLAKGNNINPFWRVICDSVGKTGDVTIFRNKAVLPFGFVYHNFMKEGSFDHLSTLQKELVSLRTCILNEKYLPQTSGLGEFQARDTFPPALFTPDSIFNAVTRLKTDSLVLADFNDNHFAGNIQMSEDGLLYLQVPVDDGWQLMVDGNKTEKLIVNGGMTGVVLKKGGHKISLDYNLRYWNKGLLMSLLGLMLAGGLFVLDRKQRKSTTVVSTTESI